MQDEILKVMVRFLQTSFLDVPVPQYRKTIFTVQPSTLRRKVGEAAISKTITLVSFDTSSTLLMLSIVNAFVNVLNLNGNGSEPYSISSTNSSRSCCGVGSVEES